MAPGARWGTARRRAVSAVLLVVLLAACAPGGDQVPAADPSPAESSAASPRTPSQPGGGNGSSDPADPGDLGSGGGGRGDRGSDGHGDRGDGGGDRDGSAVDRPVAPVRIAFAGDVHFAGSLASRLDHPGSALGPLTRKLADADLASVNLETAVTTRGTPQPKEYTFRAPPAAFTALRKAGVDVVTMANNHGLDYGSVSVPDALAAADKEHMPLIGIGRDSELAFKPWIAKVHGQRIAFIAASAVVDAALVPTWSASRTQPGIATALDGDNADLVAAIRQARQRADTVVVHMHWGADLTQCPTAIQQEVARDAVRAGADVVVGQHAHILLGGGYLGRAYVDYGLGNFQFYSYAGPTSQTGVLTLTVRGRKVTEPIWTPGQIEGGLPVPLRGAAAEQAGDAKEALRSCTGLTAAPEAAGSGRR